MPSQSDSLDSYERVGLVEQSLTESNAYNNCTFNSVEGPGQLAAGERAQVGGGSGSVTSQDHSPVATGGSAAAQGDGAQANVVRAPYPERWRNSKTAVLFAILAVAIAIGATVALLRGMTTIDVAGYIVAVVGLVASGVTPFLPDG